MKMTRSQATRNIAVSIVFVIGGIVLLLMGKFLTGNTAKWVIGGFITVIGLIMLGEQNKLPGIIAILIGVAIILLGSLVGSVTNFIAWIVIIAGAVMFGLSLFSVKKGLG